MSPKLILLVEDEGHKREHITRLVTETLCDSTIKSVKSVKSALDFIDDTVPDLILLDMSLPTYEIADRERGGRPQGYGGKEILRYLVMEEQKIPTVVITGYDAFPDSGGAVGLETLKEELFSEFPEILQAVLRYDSTFPEWRDELTQILTTFPLRE